MGVLASSDRCHPVSINGTSARMSRTAMLDITIQLAGRSVHLVRHVRDCDLCRNRARHARLEGRPYLQSEINRVVYGDAWALARFRELAATYGLLTGVHRVSD